MLARSSLARRPALAVARACSTKASPAPAAPAAPAKAAEPAAKAAPASADSPSDSKHSTDIAFKPNDDGWGYTKRYANGWDNIFGKKSKAPAESTPTPAAAVAPDNSAVQKAKQMAALEAAHACGALSDALLKKAQAELDAKASS